jgi:Winged helix DNA-binding domain
VLAREIPLLDQVRYKLLSRHRAHGLLGASPGADILSGLGPARPDPRFPDYPGRNALPDELVERGEIVPVDVEGVRGKRFVIPEDVELIEAPPEPPPSVAFLPPFDALVWDRALLGSLFGFDYVWELFVPPAKRRWGWYVLPILFVDRFVGRIEPRIDRAGGRTASRRDAGGSLPADSYAAFGLACASTASDDHSKSTPSIVIAPQARQNEARASGSVTQVRSPHVEHSSRSSSLNHASRSMVGRSPMGSNLRPGRGTRQWAVRPRFAKRPPADAGGI